MNNVLEVTLKSKVLMIASFQISHEYGDHLTDHIHKDAFLSKREDY